MKVFKFFYLIFLVLVLFSFELMADDKVSKKGQIDRAIQSYMIEKNIPGIAVAYYFQGEQGVICYGVISRETKKPVLPDTIFQLGSITKVFASTELALEILKGEIHLEDRFTRYISVKGAKGAIHQVTLKELATHTSSLPRQAPKSQQASMTREKILHFLQGWQPSDPIGTHFLYSNLGFGLLGYALEVVKKQSFEQLIKKDILLPLHMSSTMTEVPPQLMYRYAQGYSSKGKSVPPNPPSVIPASGSMRSTGADMLGFLLANLGVSGPRAILDAMQYAQKGIFKVKNSFTMGLAWQRIDHSGITIIDKDGGVPGFSSYIGMVPDKKIGLVILGNQGKANFTPLGRRLLSSVNEQAPPK